MIEVSQLIQDMLTGDFNLLLAEQLKKTLDLIKYKSPKYDRIHKDWVEGLVTTWYIRKITNESTEILKEIEKEIIIKKIDSDAISKLQQFKSIAQIIEKKFNEYGISNDILDSNSIEDLLESVKDEPKYFITFRK